MDDVVKDTGGGTGRGGAGVDVTAVADSALGGAATPMGDVGIAAEEPDRAIKDITQSIASSLIWVRFTPIEDLVWEPVARSPNKTKSLMSNSQPL